MIFANASLTISRKAPKATAATVLASSVAARITPIANPHSAGDRPALGATYHVYLDAGVDVRMHDQLTGWNPRAITPAPELVVQHVRLFVGPTSFLQLEAVDQRTRES